MPGFIPDRNVVRAASGWLAELIAVFTWILHSMARPANSESRWEQGVK